ncbi:MAG TPA: SWIM zinc finger family protein, partial [Pilimelia sp.]|nr:SWIM zinc finger family protein [Pilimelia sp.]
MSTGRWSEAQVLALAPDAASRGAARGLAGPARWSATGAGSSGDGPPVVWGLCQGSGAQVYQTCIELGGPAYRCSCPSRKFPCKHAVGLLLLWAAG